MHTCTWYISDSVSDVLAQVIKDMAVALRSHSRNIDLDVISAKDYGYKSVIERTKNIFGKREIWHLFGRAPAWWRIVRLHSRTVHTLLEKSNWSGYPSRFFNEGAKSGEAVIFPVFDPLSSYTEDGKKAVFVREGQGVKIPEGDYEVSDITERLLRPEALSGIYIASETGPREAMRAGILTMREVAIASQKSGWLDEILGPDGYFLIRDDDDLPRIIRQGLGDRGRHLAMSARHFLKSRRSHERCTDSLITLYRKVISQ
ncbi:MAG: hypothetical protein II869_00890 [Synergistaceae bacterium]|nr:hypothetical protein [Synergistaceae bacterium]